MFAYVDDIPMAVNGEGTIKELNIIMNNEFKIKNLRDLNFFLGIEVTRSKGRVHICQKKYALDLYKDAWV